jgi:hypothetical protein
MKTSVQRFVGKVQNGNVGLSRDASFGVSLTLKRLNQSLLGGKFESGLARVISGDINSYASLINVRWPE